MRGPDAAGGKRVLLPKLAAVYLFFAHLALAGAFLVLALDPGPVWGFFYGPHQFAVVHLVTLGWITCSINAATIMVAPMALQMQLRATWVDGVVCGGVLLGVAGIVTHFWLESYTGVWSSALILLLAFGTLAWRVFAALSRAKSPLAIRLHVGCAYANLLLATVYGIVLALNKRAGFLEVPHLTTVFGHVHLAAVGWALMMVVGVGYRLLPMYLPAAPPARAAPWLSLVLLQGGVLGLSLAFLFDPAWRQPFAVAIAAGLGVFLLDVVRMKRNPRPPPAKLRRPDVGMLHALQSFLYLLLAAGVGMFLVFNEEWQTDWIMAYGVFGLVGFLAQIVVGISMRLLPMFSWKEAWTGSGFRELPPSPHEMPLRRAQVAAFVLWSAGTPLLAVGLGRSLTPCIAVAAWLLLCATLLAGLSSARVLRHALARSSAE